MRKKFLASLFSLFTLIGCSPNSNISSSLSSNSSSSNGSSLGISKKETNIDNIYNDLESIALNGNYTLYSYISKTYVSDFFSRDLGYIYYGYERRGFVMLDSYKGEKIGYNFTLSDLKANITSKVQVTNNGSISYLTSLNSFDPFSSLYFSKDSFTLENDVVTTSDSSLLKAILDASRFDDYEELFSSVSFYYDKNEELNYRLNYKDNNTSNDFTLKERTFRFDNILTTRIPNLDEQIKNYTIPEKQLPIDMQNKLLSTSAKFETTYYRVSSDSTKTKFGSSKVNISQDSFLAEIDDNYDGYGIIKAQKLENDKVGQIKISALTGKEEINKLNSSWDSLGFLKDDLDISAFREIDENLYDFYGFNATNIVTDISFVSLPSEITKLTFNTLTNTFIGTTDGFISNGASYYYQFETKYVGSSTSNDFILNNPITEENNTLFKNSFIKGKLDGTSPYQINSISSTSNEDKVIETYTTSLYSKEDVSTSDYINFSGYYQKGNDVLEFTGHKKGDTISDLRYIEKYENKTIKDIYLPIKGNMGAFKKGENNQYTNYLEVSDYEKVIPYGPNKNYFYSRNPELEINTDGNKILNIKYNWANSESGGQDILNFNYENIYQPTNLQSELDKLGEFVKTDSWKIEKDAYEGLYEVFQEKADSIPYLFDKDFSYWWLALAKKDKNYVNLYSASSKATSIEATIYLQKYCDYLVSSEINYTFIEEEGGFKTYHSPDKTIQIDVGTDLYEQSIYVSKITN